MAGQGNTEVNPGSSNNIIGTSSYRSKLSVVVSGFDSDNPLGLEHPWDLVFSCISPLLWASILLAVVFSLWVLESKFLQPLPSTPILAHLMYQISLLTTVGPLYTWMMQDLGVYVVTQHIHQCFVLTWAHNFALLSSASLLVFFVIERGMSIEQTATVRDTWVELHKRNRRVCLAILVTAAPFSILGFLISRDKELDDLDDFPVCHPWWNNEHTPWRFLWVWFFISFATLVPGVFVSTSMVMVAVARARYKDAIRTTSDSLDRFRGLTLELKSKSNRAFSRSPLYLGSIFLLTYLPLGVYVYLGPVMDDNMSPAIEAPTTDGYGNNTARQIAARSDDVYTEWSYVVNLSRRWPEVLIWFACYSVGILIPPALAMSDVLFKREALGRLYQIKRRLCRQPAVTYNDLDNLSERWEEEEGDDGGASRSHGPHCGRNNGEHEMSTQEETPDVASLLWQPKFEKKDDVLPTPFLQAKDKETTL